MYQNLNLRFRLLKHGGTAYRHAGAGLRGPDGALLTLLLIDSSKRDRRASGPKLGIEESVLTNDRLVSVVDDDVSMREAIQSLLQSFGFEVAQFSSAEAFLASDARDATRCLVLDITMPDMTGPELQYELMRRNYNIPIIFITAGTDDPTFRALLESNAIACIYKPLNEATLLAAVESVFGRGKGE